MAASRRTLSGYASYMAHTNSDKKGDERQSVVRFEARWQLAKGFDHIAMEGEREKRTTSGYSALLRVTLAYSAVDQFEVACGVTSLRRICDRALADELRSVLKIHAVTGNEQTSGMRDRGRFRDIDATDDVRVFAYAFRNMFVHGSATPWGVGATTKPARLALNSLSECLLGAAEREFEAWAKLRAQSPE